MDNSFGRRIGDLPGTIGVPAPLPQPPTLNAGPQASPQSSGLPDWLEAQRPQKRGVGNDIMGSIFDALAVFGGGESNYWNGVNRSRDKFEELQQEYALTKQRLDAAAQQREQDRLSRLAEPTGFQRNVEYVEGRWGGDAARDYVMKPQFVQNWDGTRTQVNGGDESYTDPDTGITYDLIGSNRNDPNAWKPRGAGSGQQPF